MHEPLTLDRRRVILAGCSDLFERRGYYGTSLRMIARAAGITPSLLQKYYPTKEAIIAAFVERAMDELDAFVHLLRADAVSVGDPRMLLHDVGLAYAAFLNKMRGFYLTWLMCPELIEPYRDSLPHFITAGHNAIAQALTERAGLPPEIATLRVRILFGAVFASVMYYDRLGFPGTREEAVAERVDRIVNSVLCEPLAEEALAFT
ncbi:MAG: TetR/AcrR family transcriptional regulator [Candidatus Aquilonibacter sp.]|jgi:AcrR family transcriptional regulator